VTHRVATVLSSDSRRGRPISGRTYPDAMTVVSILDLHISPDATDVASTLRDTLTATRARPGCLGVDVCLDVDDAHHYLVVERWESIAADDAYRAWRATPDGASALGPILAQRPVLTRTELDADI
jgi:heme oxygenase (mycobilin-producing)